MIHNRVTVTLYALLTLALSVLAGMYYFFPTPNIAPWTAIFPLTCAVVSAIAGYWAGTHE